MNSPYYRQHRTRPCKKRKSGAPTVSKREGKPKPERLGHPSYRVDRPPVDWQILEEASPVWLRLECDTWPQNVERPLLNGKFRLGGELRKRWKSIGELQLDSVESEPVKLDLREGIQHDAEKFGDRQIR